MTKAHRNSMRTVWIQNRSESGRDDLQWQDIDWKKLERRIFKLQKRIYRASLRGDFKTVRKLQKTLTRSHSAKCMALRKSLQKCPQQKLDRLSVDKLEFNGKAKLASKEKRAIRSLLLFDTALQALAKLALEPEWEAKFAPDENRKKPGFSRNGALKAILFSIARQPKYAFAVDSIGLGGKLDRDRVLSKLNTYPTLRKQIKAWLEAGAGGESSIFPLLANIVLHGLKKRVEEIAKQKGKSFTSIGYADRLVFLHEDLEAIRECREIVTDWLKQFGLELKPSQAPISHTLERLGEQKPGFDFFGFNVRQYRCGKYKAPTELGYKTLVAPSSKAFKQHYQKLARTIDKHKTSKQEVLIVALDPQIVEWAEDCQQMAGIEAFRKMNDLIHKRLLRWAKRRHPNKPGKYWANKYWKTIGEDNWVFAARDRVLTKPTWIRSDRAGFSKKEKNDCEEWYSRPELYF